MGLPETWLTAAAMQFLRHQINYIFIIDPTNNYYFALIAKKSLDLFGLHHTPSFRDPGLPIALIPRKAF